VRTWVAAVSLGLALAGCSSADPEAEPSRTATLAPTSTPVSTPSTSPSPTEIGTPVPEPKRLVVPPGSDTLSEPWREVFVIPYGPGEELLGTSPGGDSGTLDIGPEYGAPGPDGTWWFLDTAKQRLAHYSADGGFLDAVRIPARLLVDRRYFQWQLPHTLADGTLVAARQTFHDGAQLLRLRQGALDEVAAGGDFAPTYSDGTRLFSTSGRDRWVAWDPVSGGGLQVVRSLTTPTGSTFLVTMDFDRGKLRLVLPEAGVARSLPVRTASGARAHVGLQVRAGADGTVHLFLAGAGEDDESVQLVGYASVSPSGTVSRVEPLPDPFSEADPGSPAQLVIAPGATTPMLVYVLEDGVHVFARTG